MRNALLPIAFLTFLVPVNAQSPSAGRFIEVLVTDTVHLPFAGMDYEVRMPGPFDLAAATDMGEEPSERAISKALDDASARAVAAETKFKSAMDAGGFAYKLSSSENTMDYQYGTDRSFEVNTYVVTLTKPDEFDRFNSYMQDEEQITFSPKNMRYGPASDQAPRIMRKLYDQARKKAEALVAVTGGRLGAVISAQEVKRDEGSFLEQLFKMDKMGGNDEETLRMLSSSFTTSMAFRFVLAD